MILTRGYPEGGQHQQLLFELLSVSPRHDGWFLTSPASVERLCWTDRSTVGPAHPCWAFELPQGLYCEMDWRGREHPSCHCTAISFMFSGDKVIKLPDSIVYQPHVSLSPEKVLLKAPLHVSKIFCIRIDCNYLEWQHMHWAYNLFPTWWVGCFLATATV